MLTLDGTGLLRTQALIAGCWVDADDGSRFAVHNPFDGTLIATVPRLCGAETQRAIDAARGRAARVEFALGQRPRTDIEAMV